MKRSFLFKMFFVLFIALVLASGFAPLTMADQSVPASVTQHDMNTTDLTVMTNNMTITMIDDISVATAWDIPITTDAFGLTYGETLGEPGTLLGATSPPHGTNAAIFLGMTSFEITSHDLFSKTAFPAAYHDIGGSTLASLTSGHANVAAGTLIVTSYLEHTGTIVFSSTATSSMTVNGLQVSLTTADIGIGIDHMALDDSARRKGEYTASAVEIVPGFSQTFVKMKKDIGTAAIMLC